MRRDAETAGRFTADRHLLRITAESRNIVLDPSHRELLVHEPVVASVADVLKGTRRGRGQHAGCKEAEAPQTIVDRNDDDVVVGHHHRWVVVRPGAVDECAAVNPYENR